MARKREGGGSEWATGWLETTAHLKPKTRDGYASLLRHHIIPRFGSRSLSSIRPVGVQRFVSELTEAGLSPSRIRQVRHLLGMLFTAAIANGMIARSPVSGGKGAPRTSPGGALSDRRPGRSRGRRGARAYRALVYLLAYGGLRWGEMAALRRSRCNLLRSRIDAP